MVLIRTLLPEPYLRSVFFSTPISVGWYISELVQQKELHTGFKHSGNYSVIVESKCHKTALIV